MKALEKEEATKSQSIDKEGEADIETTFLMNLVNKERFNLKRNEQESTAGSNQTDN